MSCIAASRQESSISHESMSGNGSSATNVSDEPSGYYGEDSGSNYGRSISSSSYSRASDGGSIRNIEWYSHGISRASSSDEQKVGTGESGDSGSRSYYFGEQQSSGPRGNTGRQLSDYSESKYSGVRLDDEQAGGPVIYLKDLDLEDVYSAGGQSGGNGGSFSGVSGSTYYGQSSAFGKQGGYGDIAKMGTGLSERSPTAGYRASFEGSFSGTSVGDILLHTGGKETMQNLNSRLAAYIDKVRVLEAANAQLEYNIRKWYDSNKVVGIDNSKYFQMIEDLKNKIIAAILDNNKAILHIDNARVAAADFKLKYEAEVGLRQAADYDVNGLRKELDDLTLTKSSLEMKIESQREELAYLKKSHEEEINLLRGLTGSVTVELNAAPGNDMLSILNEMRTQYENLAEENRIKAGEEFNRKTSELNQEIRRHSEQVQLGKDEATELRRNLQSIEIDLQTQIALKNALENTLAETEGRYCVQLNKIQDLIRNLEEQLSKLRFEMEDQSTEYKLLMDIKTRLENEIEMYRHLLEGEGTSTKYTDWLSSKELKLETPAVQDPKKVRHVTTIIEERVGERVISTKVNTVEQRM